MLGFLLESLWLAVDKEQNSDRDWIIAGKAIPKKSNPFSGDQLKGKQFIRSDMENTNFEGCNLAGARFWAVMTKVTFTDSNLEFASFDDVSLEGAVFSNINLSAAKFENVNLSGTQFHEVNFSGASISATNLSGLSLNNVNLEGMTIEGILVSDLLAAYKKVTPQLLFSRKYAVSSGIQSKNPVF